MGKRKWGELSHEERQQVADQKWGKCTDPWIRRVIREMVDKGTGYSSAMERVRVAEQQQSGGDS